ncbi:YceI family protein [Arthrobacter crystallopoietes]|uniref:Polyisoprenoid-binding protein YceI n=1 Tax=Crystallibacter crystallopoietes TaxID=37928 RepID=A0A1H1CKN0_9MICC|nr:YceI family protein [Arthrobacter crystallopoietes]AUI50692.1 polyisoprenoid-binding protein [Arthrobacter crystallopoietes]SDQ64785.1 Polyisoprenoid-binding protein YceI [Arthrobacter crystallopoietes]
MAFELTPGTWNLDTSHTEIGFVVRHAGISKVRGQFTEADATLVVGESLATSSVEATVKTASFDSNDDNRDGHVKSADFFDVEQFPHMTFKANQVQGSPEEFKLGGELTIKDTTKPVTFDVESGGMAVDPFGSTRAGFSATTQISRKEFGITWNAALEAGGVLVGDKVTITVDAAFVLPAN